MALRSFGRNGILSQKGLWSLLSLRSLSSNAASQQESVDCFVDDKPVSVPKGYTVLQACEAAGIYIPRWLSPKLLLTTQTMITGFVIIRSSP